jgi:hypothetical protein
MSDQVNSAWRGSAAAIFREEAMAHYVRGQGSDGDVLRLTPTWARWSYWLLVAVVVAGLLAATLFTSNEYVAGPALVLVDKAGETASVLVLLPGHARPLVQVGLPLQLTLDGYPYAYQTMTITEVDDHIVGPQEVERRLGPTQAGLLRAEGSVVMVRAQTATPVFAADGRTLPYYTGMQGRAEVRTGSERILFLLLPGLRTGLDRAEN